jgi:hypothetical protein
MYCTSSSSSAYFSDFEKQKETEITLLCVSPSPSKSEYRRQQRRPFLGNSSVNTFPTVLNMRFMTYQIICC